MAEYFGQAFWPGINGFISCVMTNSQGATPGVASFVVPFQDLSRVNLTGTLTIQDGVNPPVRFPDCRIIEAAPVEVDGGGRALCLQIQDRRWRWRYGSLFGWYNQIDPEPDPQGLP